MFRKAISILMIMVLSLTLCTACSGTQTEKDGYKSETVEVTDLAGRVIELELPVKTAVINWSGSGGAFMTMSALLGEDVADHIVGWGNSLQVNRNDMYQAYVSKVPDLANIPNVGSVDTDDFNIEKVIQLNPDVCIFALVTKTAAEASVQGKLAEAGIPVVYIDYHAETVENHEKSTLLLGQIFGEEVRAQEITDYCLDKRKVVEERVAKITSEKSDVYVECGSTGVGEYGNTYPSTTMWGSMVTIAGGNNIAEGSISKATPISPEYLLSKNADVIFLTGSYWPKTESSLRMGYESNETTLQKQLTEYTQRTGWSELNAVKDKKVFAIHHGLAREIYDFAAFEFIAKSLYPDEFKDIDPYADLQEYYEKFLPYDLTGVWMTQWQ